MYFMMIEKDEQEIEDGKLQVTLVDETKEI